MHMRSIMIDQSLIQKHKSISLHLKDLTCVYYKLGHCALSAIACSDIYQATIVECSPRKKKMVAEEECAHTL